MAKQARATKRKELSKNREEAREAKRRHEGEELRERVELAKVVEEEEAKEWEERKEGAQEGELTDLNEDTMGVKLVDPSYQSAEFDRRPMLRTGRHFQQLQRWSCAVNVLKGLQQLWQQQHYTFFFLKNTFNKNIKA